MLKKFSKQLSSRRHQRGLHLVEMAFIMPFMVILLGAIGEFGSYFHMRSTLLRATMTGANYISDKSSAATDLQAARRMAVCGKTTACNAGEEVYPGFTESNVNVTISGDLIAGKYVVVETTGINYQSAVRLNLLSGRSQNWTTIPMVVRTRMLFTGM